MRAGLHVGAPRNDLRLISYSRSKIVTGKNGERVSPEVGRKGVELTLWRWFGFSIGPFFFGMMRFVKR